MKLNILKDYGYDEAVLGLSLSHNSVNDMTSIANKLCNKDGGHNKFLESIVVWLDIDAPRYWWSQFDTYRTGTTKQSESTMHTITKCMLTQEDFEDQINSNYLEELNKLIRCKLFITLKNALPEGFLQRRIVCTNYKVLRNIILQRQNHKLKQWKYFCDEIQLQVTHKELLP